MSELLTERTPRVAAARKLLRRAGREEAGRFLVEGRRGVVDALHWARSGGGRVDDLFVTEPFAHHHPEVVAQADADGVRTALVTERAMSGLTDTVTPQGVAVVARLVARRLADALAGTGLVVVLLDVADPGNVGTILRTADAAGADAVVLAGDTVDPHNPKCVRASMGSLFHVPLAQVRDRGEVLDALRGAGLGVVVADAAGETELGPGTDGLLAGPTAWLFGSEAHGVDDAVAAAADHRVRIPIRGRAESLNLAAAAAVCLYASERARSAGSASPAGRPSLDSVPAPVPDQE